MSRDEVIASLRHKSELKSAGVLHLSVLGSTARGDRRPDSDVDLLAVVDPDRRISLLKVAGIEVTLGELLGVDVDLVEERALKPRVRKSVETEAMRAF